ncbi:hypothetical protein [Acrocarpospora catenulata]|uniref:hypothetical protein n=1 Tax=Acrocarpospora catenulata TaxID=2836182 RepID=UPI001BDABD07|nr:hypothetical protein [Acrocarpospora catenulata]
MTSLLWKRICLVLPVVIGGLLTLAPVAGAAETNEREVSNLGWAPPQGSSYVSVKCPSSHRYLVGVRAQADNDKTELTSYTPSDYPGVSKLSFNNTNTYSNPAKNVWVSLTAVCSASAPAQAPSFQVIKNLKVPGKVGSNDGAAASELNCPFSLPKIIEDHFVSPTGISNTTFRYLESIPQRLDVIWYNSNDSATNVTLGLSCGLLPI